MRRSTHVYVLVVLLAAALLASIVVPLPAQAQAPVQVTLVDEGLDPQGQWFQRLRVTIGPGGSLTLASETLYGDQLHADELFAAARAANQSITAPSNIPVGQEIIFTIDPRTSYVIREHSVDQTQQARRLVYTNGVQRTVYVGANSGLLQEVIFPSDRPAKDFVYPDEQGRSSVLAGGRIVDYGYASGAPFKEIVTQVYGEPSVRAMQDFLRQTGWDPNRWPPPQNERKRVVVGPADLYRDERPAALSLAALSREHRSALEQQLAERARLGLYAASFDGASITYRGLVVDPAVTAKRLAAALFGDEERWVAVARAAGLAVEDGQVQGVPPGTDPTLLGRQFEISVDLAEERFPAGPPRREDGRTVVTLRNGTVITDYVSERTAGSGLRRTVHYPSGFKRIVYRPDPLWVLALDFLHFQGAFLRGATRDEGSRDRQGREFSAQVLWLALGDLPREQDAVPVAMSVTDVEPGKVLEVVTRPRRPEDDEAAGWLATWRDQPLVVAAGLTVGVGLLLALLFGLLRRPIGARARLPLARRRMSRR